MKLFKKCMLALTALLLAGYLVSCKGNDDPAPKEAYYKVYAGDQYICRITESDLNEGMEWFGTQGENTYTINNEDHTITLIGEEEFYTFMDLCNYQSDKWDYPYAFIVSESEDKYWVFDEDLYDFLIENFEKGDYTVSNNYHIVVLTASGYAKMDQLFNDYWYNLYFVPTGETKSLFLYTISYYECKQGTSEGGLTLTTDYTLDEENDHAITLTKAGLIKFLSIFYEETQNPPYAIVIYNNDGIIADFDDEEEMQLIASAAKLEKEVDYNLFNDEDEEDVIIIELTNSGYKKIQKTKL